MPTQDVFISYAHVDNEALLEEQEGWISIFHRALEKRLSQLLGRVAVVWWDRKRLAGNHYFDETIAMGVEASTVMVSIVTPRYLKSDYCRKEVEHFASTRQLKFADRSRLFTCVKTPVERDGLFSQMGGKLGYEFFRAVEPSGRFREYTVYDPELKPLFMMALEDLAQDVSKLLADLEEAALEPGHPSQPIGQADPTRRNQGTSLIVPRVERSGQAQRVFLATTSSDVKSMREGLLRELTTREYSVVPTQPWSENAAGFDSELGQAASDVSLSVHILGASYGTIPEEASASYPVLQFERFRQLAGERAKDRPLARILWVPRDLHAANEKQRKFLDAVRNDADLGALDELLEGSEEELKERVLSKLDTLDKLRREQEERARRASESAERASTARSSMAPPAGAVKKVYVISSDAEEADQVMEVEQVLGGRGFDVISSVELSEEETEAAREARHQAWLEECDGCLIFHGNTKVSWVRAQIDEVRKAMGHRVESPMAGHAVYLAPPLEGLKLRYQVHFPKLEGGAAPEEALQPFVTQLEASEGLSAAGATEANVGQ